MLLNFLFITDTAAKS